MSSSITVNKCEPRSSISSGRAGSLNSKKQVARYKNRNYGKIVTVSHNERYYLHKRTYRVNHMSTAMFSGGGVNLSMAPSETLSDETGCQKSKMAAEKNEIKRSSVSIHDSNEISTVIPMFSKSGDDQTTPKTVRCADEGEIKDGCHLPEVDTK